MVVEDTAGAAEVMAEVEGFSNNETTLGVLCVVEVDIGQESAQIKVQIRTGEMAIA